MYAAKSYETILVGDIYNHSIEGVCVLADVTDHHYWFFAADIDAKYPSNQDTPRAFKTEKLKKLDKPHVPVEIKSDAFELNSIVYYVKNCETRWGFIRSIHGDELLLDDDGEKKLIHKCLCFQVKEGKKVVDAASL